MNSLFHIESPFAQALVTYFRALEARIELKSPVSAWIAGGMAVNLYTGQRVTGDIDVEFSQRVIPPNDLIIEARYSEGVKQVWLDTNYNPMFALLHEEYQNDAIPLDIGLKSIKTFVLAPVDLAVSKIARFSDADREDIRDLAQAGLFDASQLAERAQEAIAAYPGSTTMIALNLRDALEDIQEARAATATCSSSSYEPF